MGTLRQPETRLRVSRLQPPDIKWAIFGAFARESGRPNNCDLTSGLSGGGASRERTRLCLNSEITAKKTGKYQFFGIIVAPAGRHQPEICGIFVYLCAGQSRQ
jgi:hypothetical protein